LVACVWGIAFVATKIALESFSPPALAALRFLIAAVPALVLARPPIPWTALIGVGLFLFAGQFLFQFFGIARGMPGGLAAIGVQAQAPFTTVLGGGAPRERRASTYSSSAPPGACGRGWPPSSSRPRRSSPSSSLRSRSASGPPGGSS